MERAVHPEILDHLSPDDPAARGSRRDLGLINKLMGNDRWLIATLTRLSRPREPVLELGAGDGRLAASAPRGYWDALDLQPPPANWPSTARWHQMDVNDFGEWDRYPVVVANLFLHHLSDDNLRRLGKRLRQHVRVVIACEPLRSRIYQWLFSVLCSTIGANAITRHDGFVSIGAGFRRKELSEGLGLAETGTWNCCVRRTVRGAYRFTATRG